MSIIIFSYDTETSGLHPVKNGIHQFAARIWVDWKLADEFSVDVRLDEKHEWSAEALAVSGKTYEQVMSAKVGQEQLYKGIRGRMAKYIDPHKKQQKAFLSGFNVQSFDNQFLRALWEANGDKYFGSWFFSNSIDTMLSASTHLMLKRHLMPNFKLTTVAEMMGMEVDQSKAHQALFDVTMSEFILQRLLSIQFDYARPEVPAQG